MFQKKYATGLIGLVSALAVILSFQNCSQGQFRGVEGFNKSSSTQMEVVEDVTLQQQQNEGVTLQIPEDELPDNMEDANIKWMHLDEDGKATPVNGGDLSLNLEAINQELAGTYQAEISNADTVLVFIFLVQIDGTVVEGGQHQKYVGSFIKLNGDKVKFIETEGLSRQEALSNCRLNADNNPLRGIECTYGQELLFERDSGVVEAKTARYASYIMKNGSKDLISKEEGLTLQEATKQCSFDVEAHPGMSITCFWNGKAFFSKIVDNPIHVCTKEYMPVCGMDGKTYGNKCEARVAGVTIDFTGKKCENSGLNCPIQNRPLCRAGEELVGKKNVHGCMMYSCEAQKGEYKGYFLMNGGKKHNFITTMNISRAEALKNCKTNAANNPKKSIICTWKNMEIYRRMVKTPGPKKAEYKGYFLYNGGKRHNFITTKDITRAGALSNCKTNAANNPKKSVMCTWDGQEIFRKIVEAPRDVFMQANNMGPNFCKSKGLEVVGCVAGEARPVGLKSIRYIYGTWGGESSMGIHIVKRNNQYFCYRQGQKQDMDRTDLVVGYKCGSKKNPSVTYREVQIRRESDR